MYSCSNFPPPPPANFLSLFYVPVTVLAAEDSQVNKTQFLILEDS